MYTCLKRKHLKTETECCLGWWNFSKTGWKYCWKRRKCWFTIIFSFLMIFPKAFSLRIAKTRKFVVKDTRNSEITTSQEILVCKLFIFAIFSWVLVGMRVYFNITFFFITEQPVLPMQHSNYELAFHKHMWGKTSWRHKCTVHMFTSWRHPTQKF